MQQASTSEAPPTMAPCRRRNLFVRGASAVILLSYIYLCLLASKPRAGTGGGLTVAYAQEMLVRSDNRDDAGDGDGGGGVDTGNGTRKQSFSDIVYKAGRKGMGGGLPGAVAGIVQVLALMWIRTVINYQYRYGTTFRQAMKTLRNEGGIRRFYRGVGFALVQNPLSKFVSTAANDGMTAFLVDFEATKNWGPARTTVVASLVVGLFRMALMPIDTCKTVLQVDSTEGFRNLIRKVRAGDVGLLYQGAIANAVSSIMSNYPWFYVYNLLSTSAWVSNAFGGFALLKNASIGFVASVVSDVLTNSVRVIKTTKQSVATKRAVGYWEAIRLILATDGWKGLFGRGLKTKVLANAIQSVVFTVVWRGLAEWWGSQP